MPARVPQRKNKVKPKKGAKKGTTKATGRSYETQRKFNATPEQKKNRAALNRANRKAGTYGNGDKKDVSHKGGKIVGMEAQSKNRARNGKGSTRKKKRG